MVFSKRVPGGSKFWCAVGQKPPPQEINHGLRRSPYSNPQGWPMNELNLCEPELSSPPLLKTNRSVYSQ